MAGAADGGAATEASPVPNPPCRQGCALSPSISFSLPGKVNGGKDKPPLELPAGTTAGADFAGAGCGAGAAFADDVSSPARNTTISSASSAIGPH